MPPRRRGPILRIAKAPARPAHIIRAVDDGVAKCDLLESFGTLAARADCRLQRGTRVVQGECARAMRRQDLGGLGLLVLGILLDADPLGLSGVAREGGLRLAPLELRLLPSRGLGGVTILHALDTLA